MKKIFTLLLISSISVTNAQTIYKYEKEINNIENYSEKEIEIINSEDNIKLFGTLLTPKKDFDKIIIIVPGSGIDTRYSHYKLSEGLLKNNIAVFRYDERGVGKSEGRYWNVTYGISQMTSDLLAVVKTLKSNMLLSNKKFGLLGHSLGGMATIGIVQRGIQIDFLVQWATPIEKHGKGLIYQVKSGLFTHDSDLKFNDLNKKIKIMEVVHKVVEEYKNDTDKVLSKKLDKATKKHGYTRKNWERFKYYTFPSTKDLLRQNYEDTYKNIDTPLFYIIGSEDKFVSSKENVELLNSFQNKKIETRIFKGLNHYLREGEIKPLARKETPILYDLNNDVLSEIIKWTLSK